ncbi:hypothetical protein V6N11_060888 [Hibiscus sabdariffa]|uniref:Uncharacterized protein n=1 Tax=Hibiscus sabdariffa TaxID=183260 RepID=A0ABR2QRY1_9ROSI
MHFSKVEKSMCTHHHNNCKSMSAQPVSLANWDVFEKQRPDGRVDKYYRHKELRFVCRSKLEVSRYETSGVRPQRPKKTKFNKEQTEALEPLLAMPWKDKADDNEVQECSNESLKNMHNSNPSTSTMPSTSAVLKGKSEGKKKTEKMKRPSHESDIDMDDIVAFSQLVDVPKTIIDRFDDE